MNKTAIKNFAVNARVSLMEAVRQRAYEYEIVAGAEPDRNLSAVGGRVLSSSEKEQRKKLVSEISAKGYEQVIEEALAGGIAPGVCLNVNIPKCDKVKGVKRVRSARGYWKEEFEERTDPHGRTYYWLTGSYHNQEPDDPETDLYWLDRDYATIVPCRPDLTAYDQL